MAMQHMASRGEYTGGKSPFGFDVTPEGTLTRNDAEQEVIRLVRDARARGLSLRAIVAELENAGIVGRSGKPLALTQVVRIAKEA
jgi:hypothetical protein